MASPASLAFINELQESGSLSARNLEAKRSLAAAVGQIHGLKPFPAVAQKLLEVTRSDDTSADQISEVLRNDPAIASTILRMANSAMFRRGSAVTSLDHAIVRLGRVMISQVITSLTVVGMFSDTGNAGKIIRDHCVGVAVLGELLARESGYAGREEFFLAGLLHDVGKLLLMQTKQFDYSLSPECLTSAGGCHEAEAAQLGFDHASLGGAVVAGWELPYGVAKGIAHHHRPEMIDIETGPGLIVAILRAADALEYGIQKSGKEVDLDTLMEEPSFEAIHLNPKRIANKLEGWLESRQQALRVFGR